MKYRLFAFILFFFIAAVSLRAQIVTDSTNIGNDTTITLKDPVYHYQTQEINLSYNYDFASHLNNAFLITYYSSGFIDEDLKAENQSRLNGENNPLGLSSDFVLQYRNLPGLLLGWSSLGFSFAVEWHTVNEMLFTDDFYSLMFNGTKQFAGQDAANLHNVSNNNLNYYQLKGGLFNTEELRGLEYGFQVAINFGNQYSRFNSNNATLYVDSLGKYIDLNGEFLYHSTEITGNNFTKIQGYGASIDLFFQKEVIYNYKFRVDIKNLGYIYWNDNTQIYDKEENIHFEGIEVDNIFNSSTDFSGNTVLDSLADYIDENSYYKKLNLYTPADISVFYSRYFSKYISAFGFFNYRIHSLSDFYLMFGADYHFNSNMSLGGNINYGAYSKFNVGFNFQVKIKPNFAIELQSRYITGLIGHSFSGIGVFVQLNYKF